MIASNLKDGFSLIELLVVIAIIGILAGIGAVGYSNYIDTSRAKALESNELSLFKTIKTDVEVAEGQLGDAADSTRCDNYISKIINNQNGKKNIYDDRELAFVNGHTLSNPGSIVKLGQTMLYCEFPDRKPEDSPIRMCACDEPDNVSQPQLGCDSCVSLIPPPPP